MRPPLEQELHQWVDAGVIDPQTADRIRAFASSPKSPGLRWPAVLAIAFGAIMVGAGVLLFVAAHWDDLSPAQRFLMVLAMVTGFHLAAGALMPRMRALGLALHAVGTVALGGGIFLAGQIFNLQEHWPGGILLWAIGAALSWWVLRDWLQATLAALLIPAWIASEWCVRGEHLRGTDEFLFQFLAVLAFTYLSARRRDDESNFRRALGWIGGLALLPLVMMIASDEMWSRNLGAEMSITHRVAGYVMAFGLPLLAAWFLRGKAALWNVLFALWVLVLELVTDRGTYGSGDVFREMGVYALCAAGSIGLTYWGIEERRRERINLGVAGFGITIMVFYFSSVMDKLGRSASLVGFGLLFLLGGWKLEQLRRKLVARTAGGTQ
jgi:uncharacterized membrane protein